MENEGNVTQNNNQVQNNVNNNTVNANNTTPGVNNTQTINLSNNATVNNQNINNVSPTQQTNQNVAPLNPDTTGANVKKNTDIPKSQAEAVSNNNEVDTTGTLLTASEAGVGTSTKTKTKEELTKKDKLLDGLPGIGVPVKNEGDPNANSGNGVKQQPEQIVKEKVTLKKKIQYFFTVILFILVAVFIYFLPEITNFLSSEREKEEVIKDGFLICSLETNNQDVTTNTKNRFGFSNEKLKTYKRERVITSSSADDTSISEADSECETLYEQTKSLTGVEVDCSRKKKSQKTVQSLDYGTLNINKVTSALTEAGGTYPNYKLNEKISKIEDEMEASGFKCKRSKT